MGGADSPWHYAMYISIVLYNVSIFTRLRRSSDSTFRAFFHVEQRNIHTVLPEKTACLEKRAMSHFPPRASEVPPRSRRRPRAWHKRPAFQAAHTHGPRLHGHVNYYRARTHRIRLSDDVPVDIIPIQNTVPDVFFQL